MAKSPICPADFQQANFGGTTCDLMTQLLLTNQKMFQFFSWMFDSNCRLSADFVAEFQNVLQPIGSVIWSPASLTMDPKEWILADGVSKSKTDYPDLYKVFGTNFGVDPDSLLFKIPNMNGRVMLGNGTRTANQPPDVPPKDPVDPETIPGTKLYQVGKIGGADEVALSPDQSGIVDHQHGIGGINHLQTPPAATGDNDKIGVPVNSTVDPDDGTQVIPTGYNVSPFKGLSSISIGDGDPANSPGNYDDYQKVHLITTEPIDELLPDDPADPHQNMPPYIVGVYYIRASHQIRGTTVPAQ